MEGGLEKGCAALKPELAEEGRGVGGREVFQERKGVYAHVFKDAKPLLFVGQE